MASPELAPLAVEFGDIHAQNIGLLRKLNESTFPVRYADKFYGCLLYTSPSPRDKRQSRMPSSA